MSMETEPQEYACNWNPGDFERLIRGLRPLHNCAEEAVFGVVRVDDCDAHFCQDHLAEYLEFYGVQKVYLLNNGTQSPHEIVPGWKVDSDGHRGLIKLRAAQVAKAEARHREAMRGIGR